jgi:hypothetical protein
MDTKAGITLQLASALLAVSLGAMVTVNAHTEVKILFVPGVVGMLVATLASLDAILPRLDGAPIPAEAVWLAHRLRVGYRRIRFACQALAGGLVLWVLAVIPAILLG